MITAKIQMEVKSINADTDSQKTLFALVYCLKLTLEYTPKQLPTKDNNCLNNRQVSVS